MVLMSDDVPWNVWREFHLCVRHSLTPARIENVRSEQAKRASCHGHRMERLPRFRRRVLTGRWRDEISDLGGDSLLYGGGGVRAIEGLALVPGKPSARVGANLGGVLD